MSIKWKTSGLLKLSWPKYSKKTFAKRSQWLYLTRNKRMVFNTSLAGSKKERKELLSLYHSKMHLRCLRMR
jgi:hypothetical protein